MRWDLSSFFPIFDGPEMHLFKEQLDKDIKALIKRVTRLDSLDVENAIDWETVLLEAEKIFARLHHFKVYIYCLVAEDITKAEYSREQGAVSIYDAEFAKIKVECLRAFKTVSEREFNIFIEREPFKEIHYYLRRLYQESIYTMQSEKEELINDLSANGIQAWSRLHHSVLDQFSFNLVDSDGKSECLPQSRLGALMKHPDRSIRRTAFEGYTEAWGKNEVVVAKALNAISGTRLKIYQHRGVKHFLDFALFQTRLKRETLENMMTVVFREIELPRRILHLKAKTEKVTHLAWYDLHAPISAIALEELPWETGKEIIEKVLSRCYPKFRDFFQIMCDKDWIDVEPRPEKSPTGFEVRSLLTGEQRVSMHYGNTLGDLNGVVHEVGHAFHDHMTRDLHPYARLFPSTLEEVASTFSEKIFLKSLMSDPEISNTRKAQILNLELEQAIIYLMIVPALYRFESNLYERRSDGELTADQLKNSMTKIQRDIYGDILERGGEHPYLWADIPHLYFASDRDVFYNFPYTFGFLLNQAFLVLYEQEGADFLQKYECFLRLSGQANVEDAIRESIGIDIESPDIWERAIRSIEQPLQQLEMLLPQVM